MRSEEKDFLEKYDITKYDRPSIATDIGIFTIMQDEDKREDYRKLPAKHLSLLMIKRKVMPFENNWALPGGFLRKGETVYEAARRELKEETGAEHSYLEMCDIFSEQDRDPRGWIISQAFMALINGEDTNITSNIQAGGDAKEAKWFNVSLEIKSKDKKMIKQSLICDTVYQLTLTGDETLTALVNEHKEYRDYHEMVYYKMIESKGLAFDHGKIITCIINKLRKKVETDGKIIFDLMPQYFTFTDVQSAFEIVLNKEMTAPNFRRRMAAYVQETEKRVMNGGHRPSKLLTRNVSAFYE